MAKRKRLSPPAPEVLEAALETKGYPLGVARMGASRPPVAEVAGEAATLAALSEVASEIEAARREGRMVLRVPLEAIDETHLVRDRISLDAEDMAALTESLRARGQQTPIDVTELAPGCYGLISGWRRLCALKALYRETADERFAQVLILVREPQAASEAYLAMVEENEIRAGLSYYERARIGARAAEAGAFASPREAVATLFAAGSRAKRSKINSFLKLYKDLDAVLVAPAAISERLGLALVKRLESDPTLAHRLRDQLKRAENPRSELAVLERAAAGTPKGQTKTEPKAPKTESQSGLEGDVSVRRDGRCLVLEGPGVSAALETALKAWLAARS